MRQCPSLALASKPLLRRKSILAAAIVLMSTGLTIYALADGVAATPNLTASRVTAAVTPVPTAGFANNDDSQLPEVYRKVRRAGYDYEPPPIPFGESYPPR